MTFSPANAPCSETLKNKKGITKAFTTFVIPSDGKNINLKVTSESHPFSGYKFSRICFTTPTPLSILRSIPSIHISCIYPILHIIQFHIVSIGNNSRTTFFKEIQIINDF